MNGIDYTTKSDVWSFSIFLYEVFSYGRLPFNGVSIEPIEDFKGYLLDNNRLIAPDCCPYEIFEIMNSCWKVEPNERPSFYHLKKSLSILKTKLN